MYWPWKSFSTSLAKYVGPLSNISSNSWEQLLYKCGTMKNPVPGRKQSTVHNPRPLCVQTCTQSHDKHTFLTVQASELAYMSLYIIYLYLVKNKLHNSTNLETCFFKLKMTKKGEKRQLSKLCLSILYGREEFTPKLRSWGVEGEKYKTSLSPHLQILIHSSHQREKKRGKGTKKKKRPYRKTFILLENSSMLHTSERKKKGWGGAGG